MTSFSERLFHLSERDTPTIRYARRRVEERYPELLGRLDSLVSGRAWVLGGPMNGQRARCRLLVELAVAVWFDQVVETGTFLGATTEFLRFVFGVPVWSAELRPRYWGFAAHRLSGLDDVHLFRGDSRALLERLSARPMMTASPTFFYLDAHWYSGLPLWDEISLILGRWENPMILVDDFQVPGDEGYGFDDYGPGKCLSLRDLRMHVELPSEVVFPTIPSERETGARRGYCLVGKPGFAASLGHLQLTAPLPLAGTTIVPEPRSDK